LLDGLGTAEMWHVFLTNRVGDVHPGTLGKVVPGFEVRVCDDQGTPLPDGEVGFLWVRGRSRALGYVQQHDKSCQAFRGEWYASGDMVSRDSEGVFTYAGRGDDMLKVSGKWLSPQEVESCLMRHALVEECAVVGVSDERGLVKPCAFVRARELAPGLDAQLRDWVRERLAAYKAPREVVFLQEFPRTHLGKIDRGRLKREHGGSGARP
jgi:acyl-coenzyme A synthetase/AMP-(fatty) acid ligase